MQALIYHMHAAHDIYILAIASNTAVSVSYGLEFISNLFQSKRWSSWWYKLQHDVNIFHIFLPQTDAAVLFCLGCGEMMYLILR